MPFFGSPRGTIYYQCIYYLEKYDELSESVAFAQNWSIVQTRMDKRGEHIKMNFDYFQIQKWVLQTVRAEKVDETKGHLSSFHVSFLGHCP